MSGDVQPRKRKDKKNRKDEGDGFAAANEDLNIHIYKDGATGGNICAKIVFFLLLSALAVLIGLIIRENQGLNELESIEQESRYAQIFEKWIDQNPEEHDDHSPELHDHDEDDDHEEEDGGSDESDVEETEEEQSQQVDDDDDHAEDTEEEQSQEDDEEEEEEDSTQRSEEGDSFPRSEEATEESEEVPQSEEDESVDDKTEEETREESEEQEADKSEQVDETAEDESEETDKIKQIDLKNKDKSQEEDNNKDLTSKEKPGKRSKEDKDDKLEEGEQNNESEKEQDEVAADKQDDEPANKESSGMTTKIVVGLALLAVAYNVFLRKRRSDIIKPTTKTTEQKEPTPDLSRRNTIIPPPSLLEVEPDLPEDNEMEDQEYSEDEYSDEDSRSEHRTPKEEYQDLRTTYCRALTPEGEFDVKNKQFEEDIFDEEIEEEEIVDEEIEEEEIDDDDDYEKFDEDDDEELLKRLEAKYGKLGRDVNVGEEPESESDKEDYEQSNITNKADFAIKEDIDAAQEQLHKNAAYANKMFEALLQKYPLSPRVLYGRAKALDYLAEERKSNELLKQSLSYYVQALNLPDVPDQLIINIAERYIDRARFIGQYNKAIAAHWKLIERFPENVTYLNNLAVTYLTINLVEEARSTLKKVLSKWPNDGFALVHYGFILKTADNNLEDSIHYMSRGLQTKAPGVVDGRFYFQLGDALTRLNRNDEAIKLYEEGVQHGLFKSKFQRSLYNVDRLTAKPWWESKDLPSYQKLFAALKENWQQIRQEGLSALNEKGHFRDEAENLKDTGTWKQLELFARGQKFSKNCARSPVTCGIIQNFVDASGCRRGQSKFSVMHPGTHVWPHCGPTNCRLRVHLGLKVPTNTFIRVAEETRSWKEGDIIIFDDSFEHEVWHNGTEFRLVLIVDVWHPNLTPTEKKTLSSI